MSGKVARWFAPIKPGSWRARRSACKEAFRFRFKDVLGIWVEEFDALPDGFFRRVVAKSGAGHGLSGTYQAQHYFDLLHCQTADVLATYGDDFYAGRPAATVNRFGQGRAYYIGSRNEARFHDEFFGFLARELAPCPAPCRGGLPKGVTAHVRHVENRSYLFLLNFLDQPASVALEQNRYVDAESGAAIAGSLSTRAVRIARPARRGSSVTLSRFRTSGCI